jgi:hypothetical protein
VHKHWFPLCIALVCFGLFLTRMAGAERCAVWPAVFPANGDSVSPDTHLWVICAPYDETCEPLTLRDPSGALVPIVEVAQRRVQQGPSRRLIRYAPQNALPPGSYELSDRASHSLTFHVVSRASRPPRIPQLLEHRFTLQGSNEDRAASSSHEARLAQFVLAADDGLIVADMGEPNDDPLDVVSNGFIRRAPGRYDFWFGWGFCHLTFPEADYCTRTRVRFGTLSGGGAFSGWSPWHAVDFPGPDCVARAARLQRRRLERWGLATFAVMASGGALWLLRRRRSLV